MAILVNAHNLSKSFTGKELFQALSFSIEEGDRIGLIGPNGAGKSTLLKIIKGMEAPDGGNLGLMRALKVGYLEQVPLFGDNVTLMHCLMEGAHDIHDWQEIEKAHQWIEKLQAQEMPILNEDSLIHKLSGGWKKRVAIARELMRSPQLLLLDEPTNHLDVEGILWLEELLADSSFATLTITHDRYFLQRVANRIIEIDRRHPGGLLNVKGDYATYVQLREANLLAQAKQESSLKNTLRRETEWLRRGAKARTTKQQARINRAEDLKKQVSELSYRNKEEKVKLDFQAAQKNPKKLIEAIGISKSFQNQLVIPPLDLLITAKTRLGLLGRNGCGKSTLIQLLVGKLNPDTGQIKRSEHLECAWFEQNRESLELNKTLAQTVSPDGDHVDFLGNRVHIKSYLSRFLFHPDQVDRPVHRLSGGEQARLLLAKLMLTQANLLVLDEPTNDLDMHTLDVLAGVLDDFPGAVIIVTHDRFFLDQVATHILAFGVDAEGARDLQFFTGLEQWEQWHQLQQQLGLISPPIQQNPAAPAPMEMKVNSEVEKVETQIQQKESQIQLLMKELAEVTDNPKRSEMLNKKIQSLEKQIEELMEKWTQQNK